MLNLLEFSIGEIELWYSLTVFNASNWHFLPLFTSHKIIWQFIKYRSHLLLPHKAQEVNKWCMFTVSSIFLFGYSRGRWCEEPSKAPYIEGYIKPCALSPTSLVAWLLHGTLLLSVFSSVKLGYGTELIFELPSSHKIMCFEFSVI